MTPFFRKLGLTAHITFSVGWFGAVAGFLALAVTGLTSQNGQMVTSTYLTMELITWFVIVPFCIGTLITGLVQSLGTKWGLFRHYWIVVKFLLTVISTIILLLHLRPIGYMADVVSERTLSNFEFRGLRIQLIADAGAALLVLLVITTISVYKPWGRTSYGLAIQQESQTIFLATVLKIRKPWILYLLLGTIFLVILLFIVLHLMDGGLGGH